MDSAPSLDPVRFFGRMLPEERVAVAGLMRRAAYAKGELLSRPGDVPAGLFFVEAGRIQTFMRLPGDTRVDLMVAGPGDVWGEIALSSRTWAPVAAEALEPTTAWILDARVVDGLRSQANPLAFALLLATARTSCSRVRLVLFHGTDALPWPETPRSHPPVSAALGAADLPLMKVVPLFKERTTEELTREAVHFTRRDLVRGEPLFAAGTPGDTLYVVIRGAIEGSARRGGARERLGFAGPGRLVGEIAFMDGRPHGLDATARENSILLELPRTRLDALVQDRDPLALRILDAIVAEAVWNLGGRGRRHAKARAELEAQASSSTMPIDGRPPDGSV